MSATTVRDQLHQQIDHLPNELVQQIADYTLFMMARHKITPVYADWETGQWQTFALEQFLRESDEVEYTLDDAKEIF